MKPVWGSLTGDMLGLGGGGGGGTAVMVNSDDLLRLLPVRSGRLNKTWRCRGRGGGLEVEILA